MLFGKLHRKGIVPGAMIGSGITLAGLGLVALLLTFTPLGEQAGRIGVIAANVLGLFAAGVFSAKGASCNGWLTGGVTGLLCPIVLAAVSAFRCGDAWDWSAAVSALAIGFFSGALGGVTGINLRYRSSRKKPQKKH